MNSNIGLQFSFTEFTFGMVPMVGPIIDFFCSSRWFVFVHYVQVVFACAFECLCLFRPFLLRRVACIDQLHDGCQCCSLTLCGQN